MVDSISRPIMLVIFVWYMALEPPPPHLLTQKDFNFLTMIMIAIFERILAIIKGKNIDMRTRLWIFLTFFID